MNDMAIHETPEKKEQQNNPLHGITLENIVIFLVEHYGWKELNRRVELNCFFSNPSVKSSLKFLRKKNWARLKVEQLYLDLVSDPDARNNDFHE